MSDCDLCVDACYYGDQAEFFDSAMVTARKSHKCMECGDTIANGDRYERVSGKWDGDVSTYKTCAACAEIRGVFFCNGWTYGTLWNDFDEYFVYLTTGCVDQLTTATAKAKLVERWNAWKFGR